jgi:prevent-host-death family protein
MQPKFSKDVIPLTDLKVNPGKVVNHAADTHHPVLLTCRGCGIAVIQGLEDYENFNEEFAFVKAVAQGLIEVKDGDTQSIDQVKRKFGL